ncbi:hypothetical protein Agsp01_11500 [Agromyces sp. NBRC 114283]|nr:hypothetical protein Agsp01_11500 [Agromyces sp. NBRC 114283]
MGERVRLGSVAVTSERTYTSFRITVDGPATRHHPAPRYIYSDDKRRNFATLFVDDETGIVTTDVGAFEKWLGAR